MVAIIIRTRGDRRLYESLAACFDSETRHTTERGAGRRLLEIEAQWAQATTGVTGEVEIEIDGAVLDADRAYDFQERAKEAARK